jgi:exodeoxyribonuclease V alpha subunit
VVNSQQKYTQVKEFRGVGFVTADAIAQRIGYAMDSEERMVACVLHVMELQLEYGHCFFPHRLLINACMSLLRFNVCWFCVCLGLSLWFWS